MNSVAFSPEGKRLAIGRSDNTVRILDLSNPQAEPRTLHGIEDSVVNSVAFSPDGKRLAAGIEHKENQKGALLIWDLTIPKAKFYTMGDFIDGPVKSVAFSFDGKHLAAGIQYDIVMIWDLTNPKAKPLTLDSEDDPKKLKGLKVYLSVNSVAFSPDGKRLAAGSGMEGDREGTVWIWDLANPNAKFYTLGDFIDGPVKSVAFSPDGKHLAAGSGLDEGLHKGLVRVWNSTNLKAEPLLLRGFESTVQSVAFSSDSTRLVAGSNDGTLRIWDLKNLKAEPITLSGQGSSTVLSVAFSSDRKRLAAGGSERYLEGGTVRIWNLDSAELEQIACQTAGRNFTCDEWQQFFGTDTYLPVCPELPYPKDCYRQE